MTDRAPPAEIPVLSFATPAEWSAWLEANHATSPGLWLRIAKKGSGVPSVTYPEALDGALCYGWIDGQKKSYDDASWLQKFTPRGKRSLWSKINRDKAEELIRRGEMRPAGAAAIAAAREDGRWEAAYDPQSRASVPEDFAAALERSPEAKAFFDTLDRANRYAIVFRVQTARKPETRARRIEQLVAMLGRGEKVHS